MVYRCEVHALLPCHVLTRTIKDDMRSKDKKSTIGCIEDGISFTIDLYYINTYACSIFGMEKDHIVFYNITI